MIFGGLNESLIVAIERQQQFFLGVHQLRGIQRIQGFACFHRVAGGLHVQSFDPPFDSRMDMYKLVFVVLHIADRGNPGVHRTAFYLRRTHPQVVDDIR